jgi:hypothetical protein
MHGWKGEVQPDRRVLILQGLIQNELNGLIGENSSTKALHSVAEATVVGLFLLTWKASPTAGLCSLGKRRRQQGFQPCGPLESWYTARTESLESFSV